VSFRFICMVLAFLPLAAAAEPVSTIIADRESGLSAQAQSRLGWTAEKCRRYRIAWTQLMQRRGRTGLSESFLAGHDAFIARDCQDPRDVCPRSPGELEVANAMTIAAMNAGTASTFPPFACKPASG
jgi:hypothetical protein